MKRCAVLLGTLFLFFLVKHTFASTYQVTGTVTPTVDNFPFSIKADPTQTYYKQDDIITYTITYGTTMGGDIPNYTIVASWDNDTPPTTIYKDILDYIPGSATNADDNTPPIIDLLHKQITWTIPKLLGPVSDESVSFQLKPNRNYSDSTLPVNFTTFAQIKTPYVTTNKASILQHYRFDPTYFPKDNRPTPTPTPIPPNSFTSIRIDGVTDSQATIGVTTRYPTSIHIYYSSNSKALTKLAQDNMVTTNHEVTLTNLQPSTKYYFQTFASDEKSKKMQTEFYVVTTTASSLPLPQINPQTLIVTADKNVIYSGAINKDNHPLLIFPTQSSYETTLDIMDKAPLRFTNVVERSNTENRTFSLSPRENNSFSGTLTTGAVPQTATLTTQIEDTNGTIVEQYLADVKTILPLQVVDKQTHQPLEHALVTYFVLQKDTNSFSLLRLNNLQSPRYTDPDGIDHIVLPSGTYKVTISLQGYDSKEVRFNLETDGYPYIELKKQPDSFLSWLWYYFDTCKDTLTSLSQYIGSVTQSHRVFDLFSLILLTSFVLLSYILFYCKTHFHLKSLPLFLAFHLLERHTNLIYGKVITSEKKPLSKVSVFLLNKQGLVLASCITNKNGTFMLKRPKTIAAITCIIEGYVPETLAIQDEKQLLITLDSYTPTKHILAKTATTLEFIAGLFFELMLISTLVLELFFLQTFGFTKVAPFLILSLVNVLFGILYIKDRSKY